MSKTEKYVKKKKTLRKKHARVSRESGYTTISTSRKEKKQNAYL